MDRISKAFSQVADTLHKFLKGPEFPEPIDSARVYELVQHLRDERPGLEELPLVLWSII